MRALSTLTLLASLVLVSGCRDALVDPGPPPLQPGQPAEARSMYVKGPRDVVERGAVTELRGEPVPGAVSWQWRMEGEGTVVLPANANARVIDVRADRPGPVTVGLSARGADGTQVAYGEVTFRVTP